MFSNLKSSINKYILNKWNNSTGNNTLEMKTTFNTIQLFETYKSLDKACGLFPVYESMSKFVKILVCFISYENR